MYIWEEKTTQWEMRPSLREGLFVVYSFILRLDRAKRLNGNKQTKKNHDDQKSVNQQLKRSIKILLKRVSSTPLTLNMQSVFMLFESNVRFILNRPLCRAIMTLPPTPISQLDSCNNFRSGIPASPFSFWKLFATWQWKPPRWNGIRLSAKDKACHSPAQ